MSVIKKKFPLLAVSKTAKLLAEEVESQLLESGLDSQQITAICQQVVAIAKAEMNGEYTVMGGYSPEQQLLTTSRKVLLRLDEKEGLETLLEDSPVVAETDLEDAYNAADSIQFVGSEKQVSWARNIATNASESIALAMKKKDVLLPTSAKWWIENRSDIYTALIKL